MSKTHTDVNQAKRLAEILPLNSADCFYRRFTDHYNTAQYTLEMYPYNKGADKKHDLPCWSLALLLDMLKDNIKIEKTQLDQSDIFTYSIIGDGYDYKTHEHEELIDACYEMIVKLHEKNELVI